MRITISNVIFLLFAAMAILTLIALGLVVGNLNEGKIEEISSKESRKQSDLIFMSLLGIMQQGGNKDAIHQTIQKINNKFPDFEVAIVRSESLEKQYGEFGDSAQIRHTDPHIQEVFLSRKEKMIQQDYNLRSLYPIIVNAECLGCHITAKLGDLNGVIDIQYVNTHIKESFSESIYDSLVIVAISLLFLYILTYLGVNYFISRPIRSLSQHMNHVRDNFHEASLVAHEAKWLEEIDDLTEDYNAMIEHLREAQEQILLQSETDDLTGLCNRRKFEKELHQELLRSQRYDHAFSVLMFDLNRFKSVNDSYGHAAGDFVLTEFGSLLTHLLRQQDIIARVGGDEFVVILPETEKEGAEVIAGRIKVAFDDKELEFDHSTFSVGVSVGIATYPKNGSSAEELLASADHQMYQNKAKTR